MSAATPSSTQSNGRTRSIWLWQLAPATSIVLITVAIVGLRPLPFVGTVYWAGVLVIVGTTIATLIAPWPRLGRRWVVLVPFADLVGIGLMSLDSGLRLSYLWVFPIAWIATHFPLGSLVGALLTVTAFLATEVALTEGSAISVLRLVPVLLCSFFIGITFHIIARQTGAFRRLLRRQATRLGRALERVDVQRQRANEILDGLDIAVARVGHDGRVLAANQAYGDLYRIDVQDPTPAPSSAVEYTTLRGEPLSVDERPLARAARGERIDQERVWLFDADRRWRALDVTTRPLVGTRDEVASTLLVLSDVTDLLDAQRQRESLVLTVSHELRNPITAVLGHTDLLLERGDLPPGSRHSLAEIEAAGERVLRLASSLLQRRPNGDGVGHTHTHARFDVRAVVEASVSSFRPSADARGIALTIDTIEPLPLIGDAFQLRQACDNVVGNAIKYTPAPGEVHVTAARTHDSIHITVADTGIGMTPDDISAMFEPFYRSATAYANDISGTGLGMSITREIITAHGGTIAVESTLDAGTTVRIDIPAPTMEDPP